MASGSSTAPLDVDYALATSIARLLSLFSELPSTPETIADQAAGVAREVALHMPFPAGLVGGGTHQHSPAPTSVTLARASAVSSAGLLNVLGGMPSTPPDLRAEAEDTAEQLWALISGD